MHDELFVDNCAGWFSYWGWRYEFYFCYLFKLLGNKCLQMLITRQTLLKREETGSGISYKKIGLAKVLRGLFPRN